MISALIRPRGGSLLRAFPTPAPLLGLALGLDIGDTSVKYLRFARMRQGLRVNVFGEMPLPPGAVVGGEIKDGDALVRSLTALAREIGAREVRASLSERKGYLFQTTIPRAALKDLRSVIEFQLEEHVPLPAAESLFDVEMAEGGKDGSGLLANVTVFPRRTAEALASVLTRAGLLPLSFEMEPQAIARSVVPADDRGTYMVVDFGETKTGLFIKSRGAIRFTSSIDVAGSAVTQAMVKHFGVDAAEATRIKNEYGLTRGREKREFYDTLLSVAAALRDEVNRHFIYWHTHEGEGHSHDGGGGPPIERIFLIGGNANIRGLADYLSLSMRADVVVPNVWRNAFSLDDYIPPIDARGALRYATAIGLALRTNNP